MAIGLGHVSPASPIDDCPKYKNESLAVTGGTSPEPLSDLAQKQAFDTAPSNEAEELYPPGACVPDCPVVLSKGLSAREGWRQ